MRLVKKNQGVALIVALVILVPLTLIAVVVMQSSGMSLKMAGSSASLQRVEHEVEGTLESALSDTSLNTNCNTGYWGFSCNRHYYSSYNPDSQYRKCM